MRSFAGIAAFRFIMGAFEASIAPSMLIVVSMWWTRREQPLRNNIWYSMNVSTSLGQSRRISIMLINLVYQGLATILGSLISYGLGHVNNAHLKPYQVIFLVCGLM